MLEVLFNLGISLSTLISSLLFSLFLLSFSSTPCLVQTQDSLQCPSLTDKLEASLSPMMGNGGHHQHKTRFLQTQNPLPMVSIVAVWGLMINGGWIIKLGWVC